MNILGLPIVEDGSGLLSVSLEREKFAEAIDELVNVRGLFADLKGTPAMNGLLGNGLALAYVYATDNRAELDAFGLHALLHDDPSQTWLLISTTLPAPDPSYPSVTPYVMAAYWLERGLYDMFGIEAVGHPDLRRLVHHENMPDDCFPMRKDFAWNTKPEFVDTDYPMQTVEGEGVVGVSVGPIYASVTEPAHFRFNVAGERIISFEGKHFFMHKGVEKLLEGKTVTQALPLIERISGDAAVSHALAFCQAIESLAGCEVSARARAIRTLLAELERATVHIHDLASFGGVGTGYTVLSGHGFRIKERLMRLADEIFGHRLWRGMVVPGGVARDLHSHELQKVSIVAGEAIEEMLDLVAQALASDGFRDRLETTGKLSKEAALAYGAVGIAARASGLDRDVRRDHPYAAYATFAPHVSIRSTGDVAARFILRIEELKQTKRLIQDICKAPGEGAPLLVCEPTEGRAIGAVEGARGETIHVVYLRSGLIDRYAIRDPAFCNLLLLNELVPGNTIPDFPLCYASLNPGQSGNDL